MSHLIRFPRWAAMAAALLAIAALALAPTPASAQALYGSVVGTVTDASGAPVPGVTVSATNTGTSLKLDTVSDGDGNFAFRNLLPGVYEVTAALEGFRELRQTGIRVSAGEPARHDLKLQVGALAEA